MKLRKNGKKWKDMPREGKLKMIKVVAFGILAIVLIVVYNTRGSDVGEIFISEFKEQIRQGKLERAEIKPRMVLGAYKHEETGDTLAIEKELWDIKAKYLGESAPDDVKALLDEYSVAYAENPPSFLEQLIGRSWLIILFVAIYFLFIRKSMFGGGLGGGKNFFRSEHRHVGKKDRVETFKDVGGLPEAVQELEQVVDFLKQPEKYTRLGADFPKGILLLGPPGCGKTLLARAVAGEANVPFFSVSGSDFEEVFAGLGASRVRKLFKDVRKRAEQELPAILFIDELDALARKRGATLTSGADQTLNAFLVELDGFFKNKDAPVIVFAATNRSDVLDNAILRPGRFGEQIYILPPDIKGREEILKIHAKNKPLAPNVDLRRIAQYTPLMTGADLEQVLNKAALLASLQNDETIEMEHIEAAIDNVRFGSKRSLEMVEKERKLTAYHETGHALAVYEYEEMEEMEKLTKVTIIPHTRFLGATLVLPEEEWHTHSLEYFKARLAISCAGQAGEEIGLGTITEGVKGDIKHASQIVRNMVRKWGMSELGFLTFGKQRSEPFIALDLFEGKDYSERTAYKIDKAEKKIMDQAKNDARRILTKYRSALDAIAKELLEKETLDSDEVRAIISKA